jgi:hypothetical protein
MLVSAGRLPCRTARHSRPPRRGPAGRALRRGWLRPSSRRGNADTSVPPVAGVAEVVEGREAMYRLDSVMGAKYPLEYRLVMGIERLIRRGAPQRVMLRITAAADEAA